MVRGDAPEAKLEMQCNGRIIRQGHPAVGAVDGLLGDQLVDEFAVELVTNAFAGVARVQVDRRFYRCQVRRSRLEYRARRVANDFVVLAGNQQAIPARFSELVEPLNPLRNLERLRVERNVRIGNVVIVDFNQPMKIAGLAVPYVHTHSGTSRGRQAALRASLASSMTGTS